MSLTTQDLQSIKKLFEDQELRLDSRLAALEVRLDTRNEKRLNQQTREISQVINQVVIAVDGRVAQLEKEVAKIKTVLSLN